MNDIPTEDAPQASPVAAARPARRAGVTFEVETGYGKLFVTVNSWAPDGAPMELFGAMSKANPETTVQLAALCRLASRALQAGLPSSEIVASWRGLTGNSSVWSTVESPILPAEESADKNSNVITRQIRSLPDALAVVLDLYEKERVFLQKEAARQFKVQGVTKVSDDEVLTARTGLDQGVTAGELRSAGYIVLRRAESSQADEGRATNPKEG